VRTRDDATELSDQDIRVIVFGYEAQSAEALASFTLAGSQNSPNDGWNFLEESVGVPEPQKFATSVETSIQIDEQGFGQWNFPGHCLFKIHARLNHALADFEFVKPSASRRSRNCAKLGKSVLENEK
jgi:hypothetical protein